MSRKARLVLLVATLTQAMAFGQSPPDPTPAQVSFSLGRVLGMYQYGLAALEACKAVPKYRNEAELTSQIYLRANKPRMIQAMRDVYATYKHHAGEDGVKVLMDGLTEAEDLARAKSEENVRSQIGDGAVCDKVLTKIRSGSGDLDVNLSNDLATIERARTIALSR